MFFLLYSLHLLILRVFCVDMYRLMPDEGYAGGANGGGNGGGANGGATTTAATANPPGVSASGLLELAPSSEVCVGAAVGWGGMMFGRLEGQLNQINLGAVFRMILKWERPFLRMYSGRTIVCVSSLLRSHFPGFPFSFSSFSCSNGAHAIFHFAFSPF